MVYIFFFPPAQPGVYSRSRRGDASANFGKLFPARTWSRPSFFLRCAGKKKSVNILPCIHVAYSVTLEKLTVYPLKNNVYDISSRLREFDEGAGGKTGEDGLEREREKRAGIFQNAG